MANKKLGYIPLYRSIQNHWLWQDEEPFDNRSAWIDILLSVNHEDKKLKVGNQIITIHAGQMWTSYKKLANRWNWSRERVYRYTKLLKMDEMIIVDATPNGTLLTVINYDNFAYHGNTHEATNEATVEATPKTSDEATVETQTININNINNNNKLIKELSAEPPVDGGDWQ